MQTFHSAPVPLRASPLVFLCPIPLWPLLLCLGLPPSTARAATAGPKVHVVTLGAPRKVPYTPPDSGPLSRQTPAADATTLKVRPLTVDGRQREWTTGDTHDVTDRSFAVRRALRINDALPAEQTPHWVWQPGPWLLVDRFTGHILALHLPDFDAGVSDAVWFRDYAAYCGVATTAKGGLYAVVAQIGARKAVVQKQLGPWPQPERAGVPCQPPVWQRQPMRVTLQMMGGEPMTFDVVGGTSLVEEGDGEEP